MRPSGWLFLTQLSIGTALAASAALYVHYLSPLDSGYCGPSSGCEAARRSGLGYFFDSRYVSLPLFSLVAFGVLQFWKAPPWAVVLLCAAAGQWLVRA